jgi:hypothetical protein
MAWNNTVHAGINSLKKSKKDKSISQRERKKLGRDDESVSVIVGAKQKEKLVKNHLQTWRSEVQVSVTGYCLASFFIDNGGNRNAVLSERFCSYCHSYFVYNETRNEENI